MLNMINNNNNNIINEVDLQTSSMQQIMNNWTSTSTQGFGLENALQQSVILQLVFTLALAALVFSMAAHFVGDGDGHGDSDSDGDGNGHGDSDGDGVGNAFVSAAIECVGDALLVNHLQEEHGWGCVEAFAFVDAMFGD